MEFLLDSVILVDYLNDVDEAVEYLPQVEDTVAISVVTRAEVLTGFDAPSRALAVEFLDNFPLLKITKSIADLAADLRREQRWKLPDAFQAALAAHHDLKLLTRTLGPSPRSGTVLSWFLTRWEQKVTITEYQ